MILSEKLKQQIQDRIKEAEDKQIEQTAFIIARNLGRQKKDDIFVFEEDSDFSIEAGSVYYRILHKGNVVFHSSGGRIYSFIPGSWETYLIELLSDAKIKEAENNERVRRAKETIDFLEELEERKKWGL